MESVKIMTESVPLPTTTPPGTRSATPCPGHVKGGFLGNLSSKREAVRQFTPSWFTSTMGTGSVAITIFVFPYKFSGQDAIAWSVWWLNVAMFLAGSLLFMGRFMFFRETIPAMLKHPNQSLFLGAIPMSFSTITNGVATMWAIRYGPPATSAAHALFWVNLPAVLVCILVVPLYMIVVHEHGLHSMTALWLLAVVPACVAANTAGVVAVHMVGAQMAVIVVVLGVCLLGVGFLVSLLIVTVYWQRLVLHNLPPREVILSSFLPVGPMSMTVWALLNLSKALAAQGPRYAQEVHPEWQVDAAGAALLEMLPHIGVAAAAAASVFLWGFATWWLLLAVASIGHILKQGIPFNLGWWGSVFPMGVYTGATIMLGQVLGSTTYTILGAISAALHVLLWLVVAGLTARGAWQGTLFHAPCLVQKDAAAVACQPVLEEVERQLSLAPQSSSSGELSPQRSGQLFPKPSGQLSPKPSGQLSNQRSGHLSLQSS